MSPARWLIDKSALHRLSHAEVARAVQPHVVAGLVGVSIVTELEMGYSARSAADYRRVRADLVEHLVPVVIPLHAEQRAREVQLRLVERGQHRGVGVADLILAATAELEGLTVLHYDADFEIIAEVTDQPTQWVVPRGSVP